MPDPRPLPGILAEIEVICGRAAAVEFTRWHWGQIIWVASDPESWIHTFQRISSYTSRAQIMELGSCLAGTQIVVPLARREVALAMLQEGRTVRQIAESLRITRRTVERYRAGTR